MRLETLKWAMLDFAQDPCKSWGSLSDGEQFLDGQQASVTVEQSDRNTARLDSGTYDREQFDSFNQMLAEVEHAGYGTARFYGGLPSTLEFSPICTKCQKQFASSLADADTCYECCLKRLCPPLPGRQIRHWWYHEENLWSLTLHGDVGFHNELTYWWSNRNSGGNTHHQGLVVHRTCEGVVKKLVFTTAAENANCRYRIVWDLEADTTKFYTASRADVHDNMYTPVQTELDELDPFVLDFIVAMTPSFMLYVHRPRNFANGCFI